MTRLDHERNNRRVRVAGERRDEALGQQRHGKNSKNTHKQHKSQSVHAEHDGRRINELQTENKRLRNDYAALKQKHSEQNSIKRRISEVNQRLCTIERDMKAIKKFIMATIGSSRIAADTSSTSRQNDGGHR